MSLATRRSARRSARPLPSYLREPYLPMFPSACGPGVRRVLGDRKQARLSVWAGREEVTLELEPLYEDGYPQEVRLQLGRRPRLVSRPLQRPRWSMAAGLPRHGGPDVFLEFVDSVGQAVLTRRQVTEEEEKRLASEWMRFTEAAVRDLAVHAVSLCEPELLRAVRRFPVCMRFWLYRRLRCDTTGRLLQLATSAPGVLSFAFALSEHRAFRGLLPVLFDGVLAGRRLNELLREVLEGWCEGSRGFVGTCTEAGRLPWKRLHAASPAERTRLLEEQRLLLRRASPAVPPTLLLLPPPLGFAPEDIPRRTRANARWFRLMKGTQVTLANQPDTDPEVQRAIARLVSRSGLGLGRPVAQLRGAFRELADYCHEVGRRPGRGADLGTLLQRSRRWARDHPRVYIGTPEEYRLSPETPLPYTDGLDWSMDGWTVRAIRTVGELVEEGERMHHCVGGFAQEALAGNVVFCHAELDGTPYTVELVVEREDDRPARRRIRQALGICNKPAGSQALSALQHWRSYTGFELVPLEDAPPIGRRPS